MFKSLLVLSLIVGVQAQPTGSFADSMSTVMSAMNPCHWPASAKFLGFTGGLVGSYWGVTQAHSYYCAPSGFYGMFQTALLMSTPICQTCLKVLSSVDTIYGAAWAGVFFSVISGIKDISNKITHKYQVYDNNNNK